MKIYRTASALDGALGMEVTGLVRNLSRISAIATRQGEIKADPYILSAGSYSPWLARTAGLACDPIARMVYRYSVVVKSIICC